MVVVDEVDPTVSASSVDLKQKLRNRINVKREHRVSKNAKVTKVKKVKAKVQKMLDEAECKQTASVEAAKQSVNPGSTAETNPFDLLQSEHNTDNKCKTSFALHPMPHEPPERMNVGSTQWVPPEWDTRR